MKVYITNYNQLRWLRGLVESLLRMDDAEPVIIDNASTYPPLLEWYRKCPCPVIRLSENRGCRAAFSGCVDLSQGDYYAVTDPDLDISGVPADMLSVLVGGLERYPDVCKCGLSLEIDDLPEDSPVRDAVREHEAKWWSRRRDERFFEANIGNTLAVHRCGTSQWDRCMYGPGLRSDRPYAARHMPWYITPDTVTAEDRYYWQSLPPGIGGSVSWTGRLRKAMGT